MAITLTTRTGKGEALTWDEVDNNWQLIQDALDQSISTQQMYSLINMVTTNSCHEDGTNHLLLQGSIKILQEPGINPLLRILITLNNKIVLAQHFSDYFSGKTYPLAVNTAGDEAFNQSIVIQPDAYPATIKIYLWDEKGNYATPVTSTIATNPCVIPTESIALNSTSVTIGESTTLLLNITIANGSNDYKAQYYDGTDWQDIGTFTHADATGFSVNMAATITGIHNVRIIDASTEIVSNEIATSFS